MTNWMHEMPWSHHRSRLRSLEFVGFIIIPAASLLAPRSTFQNPSWQPATSPRTNVAQSFEYILAPRAIHHRPRRRDRSLSFAAVEDESNEMERNDEVNTPDLEDRPRPSTSRVGGRARGGSFEGKRKEDSASLLPLLVTGLVAAVLSSRLFFAPSTSFVYYERSEIRSYNAVDGKVESSRRETFRSNIPSLMEDKRLGSFSEDEERVEKQIEDMLQMQQRFFDDGLF